MRKLEFYSLLLILILTSCSPRDGIVFSPEQAAVDAAVRIMQGQGVIKQETITVRQSQKINRTMFVMVSYDRLVEGRVETCLMVQQVRQSLIGDWSPRGGGGGCTGRMIGMAADEPRTGMEVSGGTSSGFDPGDPSYSHVNGLVYQEDIASIRVKWDDGKVMEAPVINGSYLIVRTGSAQYDQVEGLNIDQEVVFGSEIWIDPAKQP
jgi:hypothetical protein